MTQDISTTPGPPSNLSSNVPKMVPDEVEPTPVTDGMKALMEKRISLLRDEFERRNGVGPKLPTTSRLKRDIGRLKRFINMPLDIFLEVASSIEPLDLIYLSRVSKEFHATFMSRSARFVWVRVLESVPGLPGCPPDMTEPQYASLIFEQQCSACNSVRASKVYFTLRVRFCSACAGGNLRRGRNILSCRAWPFEESIYRLLPANTLGFHPFGNNGGDSYLVSEVNLVIEECLALKHDIPAQQKYMRDRKAMTTAIMEHGIAVKQWYDTRQSAAAASKEELITQRHNAIYQKLKELGCDPQYYPTSKYNDGVRSSLFWRGPSQRMDKDSQTWFNLIEKPKELTDRSWKTLRPKFEALYTSFKQRHLDSAARLAAQRSRASGGRVRFVRN